MTSKYASFIVDDQKRPDGVTAVSVIYEKNTLEINFNRDRESSKDSAHIDLSAIDSNTIYPTEVFVKSRFYKNKILYIDDTPNGVLVVYTDGSRVCYYFHDNNNQHPLTKLIIVKSKVFPRLSKRGLRLFYACYIENKYKLPIKGTYLIIADEVKKRKPYPIFNGAPSKKQLLRSGVFSDYISLDTLLSDEPSINAQLQVGIDLGTDGYALHTLTKGSKRIKSSKWYYAPLSQTRRGEYSISLRRSAYGGLNLVRRRLEDVEKTPFFRFIESRPVSFAMYHVAHAARRVSKQKVNIYFEKNANKADEGAIDVFREMKSRGETKDYFLLRDTAPEFGTLIHEPGVVKNFTLKSYWLLYRANNVIATEVPQHANILRSGNKYMRMAPYSQKFIFLQHGVTYLKAQDKNTSFKKSREGEPDYIVVGGKKERDVVVDMLGIEEERVLNVGLPIFDKLEYGHIKNNAPDKVTIMLTWKPYEEHLVNFEESTYYKTTLDVYNLLKKYINPNNIRLVAHPKFTSLLNSTDIADSVWQGTVADVLKDTKLLITDYSSVCYNVFYQGGATIFYQPDLQFYEEHNGKLIPGKDEYVGERAFNKRQLQELIDSAIVDGSISLQKVRTREHEKNYESINQFTDGKNIDRLIRRLVNLHIL